MNFNDSGTSSVRILVVDDYPNIAAFLARSLSELDARLDVVTATNAQQALERVQNGVVNILITDMDMPGMTGLELIEKLQESPAGSAIVSILVTACQTPGLNIRARHLNVREILHKPVHPERLCQIVGHILEEMDRELT